MFWRCEWELTFSGLVNWCVAIMHAGRMPRLIQVVWVTGIYGIEPETHRPDQCKAYTGSDRLIRSIVLTEQGAVAFAILLLATFVCSVWTSINAWPRSPALFDGFWISACGAT